MRTRLKQLVRSALSPLLRWLQAQLAVLDARLVELQAGQDDLARLNQAVIEAHGSEIDVIGRELAQQRMLLESLELRQAELIAEVRARTAGDVGDARLVD
jgi:hypothetical protein